MVFLRVFAGLAFAALCALPVFAEEADISRDALVGVWDVSLYFSPDAEPSKTTMVVTSIEGNGSIKGEFYGTPFSDAQVTVFEGAVVFAAVTADGTGPYAHSGRLGSNDQIEGQTLSTGRDFVMAWKATRQPSE